MSHSENGSREGVLVADLTEQTLDPLADYPSLSEDYPDTEASGASTAAQEDGVSVDAEAGRYDEDTPVAANPSSSLHFDLNQSLARLEMNSLQMRLYLDAIEEKISRMEPRLEQIQLTSPAEAPVPATAPQPAPPAPATDFLSASDSVRPPIPAQSESTTDRRRRLHDLPVERRRPPFVPADPEDEITTWSLQAWLFAHRLESALAASAALALLGIFFFSITRRAAPVLSAVTPAAAAAATAPSLTSPSKASAGIPMPPSQGAANSSSPSTPGRQDVNSVASSAGSDPQLSPASARESLPFTSTPSGNPATDLVSPYTLPSGVPSRSLSSTSGRSLPSTRVQVSSGVMAGNLVTSHPPRYPGGVAGLFHTEGKVTMQAVISKSGRVENLHVLSGHYLLRNAARNAVQTWRYRPYYVNGNPVEVATIVSVEFHR